MRIEHTGKFAEILKLGKTYNAISASIQDYWTFFNFSNVEDAKIFLMATEARGYENAHGVNTIRPYVVAEVAIRHPQ